MNFDAEKCRSGSGAAMAASVSPLPKPISSVTGAWRPECRIEVGRLSGVEAVPRPQRFQCACCGSVSRPSRRTKERMRRVRELRSGLFAVWFIARGAGLSQCALLFAHCRIGSRLNGSRRRRPSRSLRSAFRLSLRRPTETSRRSARTHWRSACAVCARRDRPRVRPRWLFSSPTAISTGSARTGDRGVHQHAVTAQLHGDGGIGGGADAGIDQDRHLGVLDDGAGCCRDCECPARSRSAPPAASPRRSPCPRTVWP